MLQQIRKKFFSEQTVVHMLPVSKIEPNPAQPRKVFKKEELCELSDSIRENGVLQPITVRESNGRYILVAGERRLRATMMAGMSEIPAIISDIDEKQSSLIALLENLQRCDLDFFEEATGIYNLIRNYGFSQEEAAKKLGKSQSAISNKLRLLRLPPNVINSIIEHNLTERHARALLRLPDEALQSNALAHIVQKSLNVSQADEYIESLLVRAQDTPAVKQKQPTYVFKDMRLFLNTINHAVDTMRTSGLRADVQKTEDESSLSMTIKIFKPVG